MYSRLQICQAGFIYRPIREKNYETANRQAKRLCDSTGYDEISLCSLSTSDYTGIDKLIPEMFSWALKENINVSLPSLRVDNFSDELMDELKKSVAAVLRLRRKPVRKDCVMPLTKT